MCKVLCLHCMHYMLILINAIGMYWRCLANCVLIKVKCLVGKNLFSNRECCQEVEEADSGGKGK